MGMVVKEGSAAIAQEQSSSAEALRRMSADRPVFVEDEASYIGAIHIPSKLSHCACISAKVLAPSLSPYES